MFGSPILVGAAVAFALVLAALGIQTWRLDREIEANAALRVQVEDAGRKIASQNAAVDKWAQAAELAKGEKDKAIAAHREEIRALESRADFLRGLRTPSAATVPRLPGAPTSPSSVPPAPPGERTAGAAVAEIRKRLRP